MLSTNTASRLQLLLGLCLPLAVLLGYMLAEPLDATSLAVVLVIFWATSCASCVAVVLGGIDGQIIVDARGDGLAVTRFD